MAKGKTPQAIKNQQRGFNIGRLKMISKNAEMIFDLTDNEEIQIQMLNIIESASTALESL